MWVLSVRFISPGYGPALLYIVSCDDTCGAVFSTEPRVAMHFAEKEEAYDWLAEHRQLCELGVHAEEYEPEPPAIEHLKR